MTEPQPIRCEMLAGAGTGFAHGFFTRQGGVSTGIYAGLNAGLGSADDRNSVLENRDRAVASLNTETTSLATPHQVHSTHVCIVEEPWRPNERPVADAVATRRPNIALGVLTADCGPVLFIDPDAGVIAAAHAGWRGALEGILENTVEAMESLGAQRESIKATLGPTISAENYEIGPEFIERFLAADPENGRYFTPSAGAGHSMFNLPAYIGDRMKRTGIRWRWTGDCTYAAEDRFFSYRRATHRGEADYGRQLSAIVIRD